MYNICKYGVSVIRSNDFFIKEHTFPTCMDVDELICSLQFYLNYYSYLICTQCICNINGKNVFFNKKKMHRNLEVYHHSVSIIMGLLMIYFNSLRILKLLFAYDT